MCMNSSSRLFVHLKRSGTPLQAGPNIDVDAKKVICFQRVKRKTKGVIK